MVFRAQLERLVAEPDDHGANLFLNLAVASAIDSRAWTGEQTDWVTFAKVLMEHPERPRKEGSSYLPGRLIGTERKKSAVAELSAVVIDCDSGDDLSQIAARLRTLGIEAVVHSTFSHLSNQTRIRFDDYKQYSGTAEATPKLVLDYLVDRKGTRRDVLGEICILDAMRQTPEGIFIIVEHGPIQKGRIVIPLAAPFVIVEMMQKLDLTQRQVHALWNDYLTAVAKLVGVRLDESCKDVSRAYYWSGHPAGSPYFAEHVRGQPLDLAVLKLESTEPKQRKSERNDSAQSEVGKELKLFAAKFGKHFQLADAYRRRSPRQGAW